MINNAGFVVPGPLELINDEDFEKQMAVNLNSVRKITNTYLPYLFKLDDEFRSKILFISSVSGVFAAPFNGAYCISKHALECMTDVYRRELRIYNIDVVSVQPGPTLTKIWDKVLGKFDAYIHSAYGEFAMKADEVIKNSKQSAYPARIVSELIYKIITTRKPKTRYMLHKRALALKILANYVPDKLVDKIIWKNLKSRESKNYRPI